MSIFKTSTVQYRSQKTKNSSKYVLLDDKTDPDTDCLQPAHMLYALPRASTGELAVTSREGQQVYELVRSMAQQCPLLMMVYETIRMSAWPLCGSGTGGSAGRCWSGRTAGRSDRPGRWSPNASPRYALAAPSI